MGLIKVLIADDHRMFREGIKALLENEKNVEIISEAGNGDEVIERLKESEPDVILMDIDMGENSPTGIEITEIVKEQFPDVEVLALTMHAEYSYIMKMLEAGATGYILKNAGKDEMLTAIRTVSVGDSYYSNQVSTQLIQQLTTKGQKTTLQKDKEGIMPLTKRETEVLKLIAQEYSNSKIAEELFISTRTVDTHRRNLLEKLNLKNTAGLVRYAIKNGLVD